MFAKSFIALDGNDRLTGAHSTQTAICNRYSCQLCSNTLIFQQ
ncbi:DUF7828 domain-containing protein [Raoultella terrigena]